MNTKRKDMQKQLPDQFAFHTRGGEMDEYTRALDWSGTPVGPMAGWPQSLKIAVRIIIDWRAWLQEELESIAKCLVQLELVLRKNEP